MSALNAKKKKSIWEAEAGGSTGVQGQGQAGLRVNFRTASIIQRNHTTSWYLLDFILGTKTFIF